MTKDELRQKVIDVARARYASDGDCEIDDGAKFSIADPPDDGLYVQAWVWVRVDDLPKGVTNDDIALLQEPHGLQVQDPLWENNEIQFARLISEIIAAMPDGQVKPMIKDLGMSMDLEPDDINEIFDRAEAIWEKAKEDATRCPHGMFHTGAGACPACREKTDG